MFLKHSFLNFNANFPRLFIFLLLKACVTARKIAKKMDKKYVNEKTTVQKFLEVITLNSHLSLARTYRECCYSTLLRDANPAFWQNLPVSTYTPVWRGTEKRCSPSTQDKSSNCVNYYNTATLFGSQIKLSDSFANLKSI